MSVRQMRFVIVNDMAPRKTSVCTGCSQPLGQGSLRDLATSRRYCGVKCYPYWMLISGLGRSFTPTNPIEFAIAWPMLTVGVASTLFDSAWHDYHG